MVKISKVLSYVMFHVPFKASLMNYHLLEVLSGMSKMFTSGKCSWIDQNCFLRISHHDRVTLQ